MRCTRLDVRRLLPPFLAPEAFPQLRTMAAGNDPELQRLREQLRQAEERAGQAEERIREEQARNENSTFRDFLKLCHSVLFRPLQIQADKTLTTKGSITNPRGRNAPPFCAPGMTFQQLNCRTSKKSTVFSTLPPAIIRNYSHQP